LTISLIIAPPTVAAVYLFKLRAIALALRGPPLQQISPQVDAWDMLQGKIVFVADSFHEFPLGQQTHLLHKRPRLCVSFSVVDRDFNIHVAEIFPAESLDDVERFGCRLALLIQPELSIETLRVHNERVALPLASRISQPAGGRIFRDFPSIEKNLTPKD